MGEAPSSAGRKAYLRKYELTSLAALGCDASADTVHCGRVNPEGGFKPTCALS